MSNGIVNFNLKDSGVALLAKIGPPRVDGENREYDLDLRFDINSENLSSLAETAPGIQEYKVRADDNGESFKFVHRRKDSAVRLTMTDAEGGEVVVDAVSDVRSLSTHLTEKASYLIVKIRVLNQGSEIASPLVENLGKHVTVNVVPTGQMQMFESPVEALTPQVGDIAMGTTADGEQKSGRVISIDGDFKVTIDDMGTSTSQIEVVTTVMKINDPNSLVDAYCEEVNQLGEIPNWRTLIIACGKARSDGELEEDETSTGEMSFTLTERVIQIAIGLHLPEEA